MLVYDPSKRPDFIELYYFITNKNPHEKIEQKAVKINYIECPVCNKEMKNENKITLERHHFLCKQCLKEYIENLSKIANKQNNILSSYICTNKILIELIERIFHPKFIQERLVFNLCLKD